MSNYEFAEISNVQNLSLCRKHVILIPGFLTENDNIEDSNCSWNCAKKIFPQHSVCYFKWPSSSVHAFSSLLLKTVKMFNTLGPKGKAISVFATGAAFSALWAKALHETVNAGKELAMELDRNGANEITLVGHSLGARIIHEYLKYTRSKQKMIKAKSIHLFGGATSSELKEWDFLFYEDIRINNYYSSNDSVLKYLYKIGTTFKNEPIGLSEIAMPKINNLDVSRYVDGHGEYIPNLYKMINI